VNLEPLQIQAGKFANPDLQIPDPKDSICEFVLEKKNSQITEFVSFWKDLYTIPASLIETCYCTRFKSLICI
jgi:hypothetical protein